MPVYIPGVSLWTNILDLLVTPNVFLADPVSGAKSELHSLNYSCMWLDFLGGFFFLVVGDKKIFFVITIYFTL
jgi:hypothetical protein